MFTVAFVGPDGAGKTTLAKHLEQSLPLPVKYLYMGDNIESSNYVLPTTRWLKTRQKEQAKRLKTPAAAPTQEANGTRRPLRASGLRAGWRLLKKAFSFTNRILDELYRQRVAAYYVRRGYVVLFDRHFLYDYYHFDVQPMNGKRPFKRRLHGFFLKYGFSEPDLVICLDAPADVVFKRKGEFSVEFLEKRRRQYLDLKNVVANFAVVNVDQDLDKVKQEVATLVWKFHEQRQTRG